MREIQYFERENISTSRPKMPDPTPLTQPKEFPEHFTISPEQNGKLQEPTPENFTISPEQNGKAHVTDDDKKKKRCKHKKDDLSDPSSSDSSDSSHDSDYRRKRHKMKSNQKEYPIKLYARLTEKLLTIAYKSKIVRFKMDEDPLQRRVCFLTFVESHVMIFSQYTENCEVLIDYTKNRRGGY